MFICELHEIIEIYILLHLFCYLFTRTLFPPYILWALSHETENITLKQHISDCTLDNYSKRNEPQNMEACVGYMFNNSLC